MHNANIPNEMLCIVRPFIGKTPPIDIYIDNVISIAKVLTARSKLKLRIWFHRVDFDDKFFQFQMKFVINQTTINQIAEWPIKKIADQCIMLANDPLGFQNDSL